jgi:HEAT repeat protein
MEATHRFAEMRAHIIASLASADPEVRSAAVATLNEANDEAAHDLVVALISDPDVHVQEEVLEYIEQFPRQADAALLLEVLRSRRNAFLASSALRRICGDEGPLVADEEINDEVASIAEWERILRGRGLVA